jgi:uncharacterized damage-inducible protein DinB
MTNTERADILDGLRRHRGFLLVTVQGLTDEQARKRTTVSELTLGGLIKHVAVTEQMWAKFILDGPVDSPDFSDIDWDNPPAEIVAWADNHRMLDTETLPDLLTAYAEVAARTDELVGTVDLDAVQPLPNAPWYEPGVSWSARRVLAHILAETAQHAGHADIIRESLDGQKTMG